MRRHKSIVNLSRDHHQGLILAQLIKKNAPRYNNLPHTLEGKVEYTLNAFRMDLLPHFKKEEEILFPFVKGIDNELGEVINQLLNEHKKITDLIIKLKKNNNKEDILDELGNLLTQHIRKEERELFEKVQEILTDEELENLDALLN
jgi:iron-sulfur cluster repair protein YtfE (RIC family)